MDGDDVRWKAVWVYHAEITQINTTTSNCSFQISPGTGNAMQIDIIRTGADDYASARTIRIRMRDENAEVIGQIYGAAVDNQSMFHPIGITTTHAPTTGNNQSGIWWLTSRVISGTDELLLIAENLAQDETFEVIVRARVRSKDPTVTSKIGTADTEEGTNITTTLDKVM